MLWLLKKLQVSEFEAPRVSFLWSLRFLYQVGFIFAWTVITAIFLEMVGIQNVLYLFLIDAWIMLLGSYAAHFLFLRIPANNFIVINILGCLGCLALAAFFRENIVLFFFFAIVCKDFFFGQLNIGLYRKNESMLSPTEAERLMPIIDSAITIATVLAAFLFLVLLEFFPTKILLFFWVMPLVLMLGLVTFGDKILKEVPKLIPRQNEGEHKNSLDEAMQAVKNVPFLRYLSVVVCAQAALFTIAEFEFLAYIKEKATKSEMHFDPHMLQANLLHEALPAQMTGVIDGMSSKYFMQTSIATELGVLALIFGLIALIVQAVLAHKILERIGVIKSMMVFLGGMLAMVATFVAGGINMKFVRGYQHGFESLFDCGYHMTFYSVFSHRRESIRHFFEGFVRPGGMIIGVGAMVAAQFFIAEPAGLLMCAITVILIALMIPMKKHYTALSHSNLKSKQDIAAKMHSIEILSQKGHHQAVEILGTELLDKTLNPVIREKIIVASTRMNRPEIIHAYLKILGDKKEAEELKIQVLESSLQLCCICEYWQKHVFAQYHFLEILKQLFDQTKNSYLRKLITMNIFKHMPQDRVVEFFLKVLDGKDEELKSVCFRSAGEIFKDPELVYYIRSYLEQGSSKIRGYALIALWNFEDRNYLREVIDGLLKSKNPQDRISAVYAIGEVRDRQREIEVLNMFDDIDDEVHLHVLIALAKLGNTACVPALLDILFGEDYQLARKTFFMLKRAPEIAAFLRREIQFEVASRVMQILVKKQIESAEHIALLPKETRTYLGRLYRLAEQYDEILVLESN